MDCIVKIKKKYIFSINSLFFEMNKKSYRINDCVIFQLSLVLNIKSKLFNDNLMLIN